MRVRDQEAIWGIKIIHGNPAPADYRALPLSEMESIVTRFKERVEAAQLASPPNKDWVRKAMRRAGADRCLTRMNRFTTDVIVRYGDALADLLCQYPDDVVLCCPMNSPWDINLPIAPAASATLKP